jgi:hypothetical protein
VRAHLQTLPSIFLIKPPIPLEPLIPVLVFVPRVLRFGSLYCRLSAEMGQKILFFKDADCKSTISLAHTFMANEKISGSLN